MPRNKRPDPPVMLRVCVPASVLARVNAFLYSDFDNGVPYGARSDLITSLLEQYLTIVESQPVGAPQNEVN